MRAFPWVAICLLLIALDPASGQRFQNRRNEERGRFFGGRNTFFRSIRPFFDNMNRFEFFEASGPDDTCEEEPPVIEGRDDGTEVDEAVNNVDETEIAKFISRTAAAEICQEADQGAEKCICYKSRMSFRCRRNYCLECGTCSLFFTPNISENGAFSSRDDSDEDYSDEFSDESDELDDDNSQAGSGGFNK